MLAARLYGAGDVRVENVEKPIIGKDEILVRVKSAALCGTDLRMYRYGISSGEEHLPVTIGHEFSGVIEEVGADVEHYQEGMRVAIAPNIGCGFCGSCVEGNTHHCENYEALGIHLDGGFAGFVRIPKRAITQGNVVVIPDEVSFEKAALTEPLASVYNGFEHCSTKPGDHVLIIGGGPIGVMHAKLALMAGAAKVMLNDQNDPRLEALAKVDPRIIPVRSGGLREKVELETKGQGLDVCIVACSSPDAQTLSLDLMALNGRVNFFGGLPKGREIVPLNTNLIHYRQLLVTGTTRASVSQYRKCLDLIANDLIDVESLITGRFTIEQFSEALNAASSGQGLKTIVNFSD